MIRCNNVQQQAIDMYPLLQDKLKELLESGDFVLGHEVAQFESWLSTRCGGAYSVSVNSATDALILALRAFGVGPGDEVITCANTFVATVGAIIAVGARPVLADVGDDELMNVQNIACMVTPRTKAVIPVYLRGRVLDIASIVGFCRSKGLVVIEDCAQAIGAHIGGTQVGTVGDAAAFSFHPLKTLGGLGDGGALVTRDIKVYEYARLVRNHGLMSRDESLVFGVNSRLDSIQAAILNVKTGYIDGWLKRRREIASYYQEQLFSTPVGGDLGGGRPGAAYCHYVISVESREKLICYLDRHGIQAVIHYPIPVHRQKAWLLNMPEAYLPNTERLASRILTIPCHHGLSDGAVEKITSVLKKFNCKN